MKNGRVITYYYSQLHRLMVKTLGLKLSESKGGTWETLESINEKPLEIANKNLIEKDFQYENRNWVMVYPKLTVILLP